MSPLLSIRELGVHLGGRRVLEQAALELEAGEHVLLCGPSGSGKSTLLRAIAGLLAPYTGSIAIAGVECSRGARILVPPHRRPIGMLFQDGALWPHLDVLEHLLFVQRWRGVPKPERAPRAARVLASVELTGFERRKPASLSGGEAQRLALARALVTEPRLLLLDEPLGPLDQELRSALLARIEELRRSIGFGILHVTHDPREAALVGARVLRLELGRVLPLEPLHAPEHSTRRVSA